MRYAFIDEIQDYTPFQLAYLKYNFPRAKFTMLGDLNQAIFTKDESKTLLSQISKLFDPEKTDVVQLTKSYRSTKEITNFTKQILRQGEKIEAFDRRGPKPAFYKRDSIEKEYSALEDILAENDEQKLTTAIITKTLAEAQEVAKVLKERKKIDAILLATGTEVETAVMVALELEKEGKDIRVVSMPSMTLFKNTTLKYRNEILPVGKKVIVIEAGSSFGLRDFVSNGRYLITLNEFGTSGSSDEVLDRMNFSLEKIIDRVRKLL